MSLLSANTLFHFTNLENLISILKNGFQPRYCLEDISLFRKENQNIAIPMVCFCDIPLSSIRSHLKQYGGYGIGLKKNWGKKNKINPVMYYIKNSQASSSLKESMDYLDKFVSQKKHSPGDSSEIEWAPFESFIELKRFTHFLKPARFYDEKEWRFVPVAANEYVISGEDAVTIMRGLNQATPQDFLKFNGPDVKYIIVNTQNEVDVLVNIIDSLVKFDVTTRNFLKTRLLTSKQILEDF